MMMRTLATVTTVLRLAVITTLMAGGLALAGPSSPASAATARNGVCEAGEFCLYYLANLQGSVSDFNKSVLDYGSSPATCFVFRGPGAGRGQCVKNNAMSALNRTGRAVTVYVLRKHAGPSQTFRLFPLGNLNSTLSNNNASHKFH